MPSKRGTYAVIWMVMIAAAGAAKAQDLPEDEPDAVDTLESEAIESGFVILGGRYLSAPYVLRQRGEEFWINDQPVEWSKLTELWPERSGRNGPGERGRPEGRMRGGPGGEWRGPPGEWARPGDGWSGPGGRRDWPGGFQPSALHRLRRHLEDGGMLIVLDRASERFDDGDALYVLNILLGDESNEAKLERFGEWKPNRISPEEWGEIVARFRPTAELVDRAGPQIGRYAAIWEQNMVQHQAFMRSEFFRSKPVQYSVTILAMGLAVVAVGTLLTHRPSPNGSWRAVDDAKERVTMVVRNVALLAALSGIDLFLTLVARQGGGFLELNPLASQMMDSPLLLGMFKMTALAVSCLILISLRRYRGAQVASWWLCLLCTILTFRWLTYNSMFFT